MAMDFKKAVTEATEISYTGKTFTVDAGQKPSDVFEMMKGQFPELNNGKLTEKDGKITATASFGKKG